jgi:hypothetical protein
MQSDSYMLLIWRGEERVSYTPGSWEKMYSVAQSDYKLGWEWMIIRSSNGVAMAWSYGFAKGLTE